MSTSHRNLTIVAAAVSLLAALAPHRASAQTTTEAAGSWLILSSSSSTTTAGVAATGFAVYYLVIKKDGGEQKARAEKAAEVYLRHNSLQLAQDINLGSGPAISELASAFNVAPAHRKDFARVVRENRKELLELARVDALTPSRAGDFVRTVADRMAAHPALAFDLGSLRPSGS
ncbi:MAG: DUF3015 family protein [Myxococcales bacterium]|nr:DUF3015 family protein [Myxococcales bacterium]